MLCMFSHLYKWMGAMRTVGLTMQNKILCGPPRLNACSANGCSDVLRPNRHLLT